MVVHVAHLGALEDILHCSMMSLQIVSHVVGWLYVISWGVANYPTIISNIQLKSVQGISIDYIYFNEMGFILYTLYTGLMWKSPLIRKEFFDEYGEYPLIKFNDLIFGLNILLTNSILLSQAYFWNFKKNDNQTLSTAAKFILSIVLSYLILSSYYIYSRQGFEPISNTFNWMKLLTSLGLIKICMSICKNIPQIIYNYNRKSTHGWPILMIWLDFLGAFLSFLQLLLDAWISGDIFAIFDNKPKLFLSIQVIISDIIFFFQHYFLYYNADVRKYGPFKSDHLTTSYQSIIQDDEEFLIEHQHDHDHLDTTTENCHKSAISKDELQRLLP